MNTAQLHMFPDSSEARHYGLSMDIYDQLDFKENIKIWFKCFEWFYQRDIAVSMCFLADENGRAYETIPYKIELNRGDMCALLLTVPFPDSWIDVEPKAVQQGRNLYYSSDRIVVMNMAEYIGSMPFAYMCYEIPEAEKYNN